MKPTRSLHSGVRRRLRWLWPLVFLATPKCLFCLLGYAGIGAAFGFGVGGELCGAPPTSPGRSVAIASATLLAYTFLLLNRNRRNAGAASREARRFPAG